MERPLLTFEFETLLVNEHGQVTARRRGQARSFMVDLGQGVTLEMVELPAGSFTMGSPAQEAERRGNEGPQHQVSVPAFFLGKYPVTQAQWQAVMQSLPSLRDEFRGDSLPVVNVWLEQTSEFCARLSRRTPYSFRLPSEAEWEYACRAGTTTPFHCGVTISTALANYDGNYTYAAVAPEESQQRTTPVGHFKAANAFGLYDLHGNVWEWCADVWHDDYRGAPMDGSAWVSGGDQGHCVQRGGSWRDRAGACRAAFRVGDVAHNHDHIVGLRVAV